MSAATRTITPPTWAGAIAQPAKEFPLTNLSVIAGELPLALCGSLYRNGPGRLTRGEQSVGHWFDGDGAILAVHFADGAARATYRYVETAGYQAETAADRFLFPNYGMTAPGPVWNNWGKSPKNVANTAVLALPDRLLALWEAGLPHALDPINLATLGPDLLGRLAATATFSAHPKRDSQTGTIYNFGIDAGARPGLNLYACHPDGRIQRQNRLPLKRLSLLHDCVLAGRYLVFCLPPLQLQILPALLGFRSFSEALEWQPSLGTQVLVCDRDTLALVATTDVEPWYQWHFANGYEQDGEIILELVGYPDFASTNNYLRAVPSGVTHTRQHGRLWRLRLDAQTARLKERQVLSDRDCEFPVIAPAEIGKSWRYTYLSAHRDEAESGRDMFGAIARYDREREQLTLADFGPNRYPSEPIFAPDHTQADAGWLLTVVYDGVQDSSELWVFDRERLATEPICRLALPSVIPHSFHGTWRAASR
ncbi:MAG: hypothetical protein HC910_16300 [Spirulinaceae cyanobacterium SM2_1_0]|nr:hypothetical protein [Spirulinaceae cyanobacterium SM2_1_0]